MSPKNIFLTGATGFLGSHLAARLLQEGHRVSAIARSSRDLSAKARVEDSLRVLGAERFENLRVCEGDISLPGLGLNEQDKKQIVSTTDEVWHCAASLSFQNEERDDIFRMNVDGT